MPLALLIIGKQLEIFGVLSQSGGSLSVGATRARGISETELVGIKQQGVGIVYLQDLLLPIQSVLLLRQGIDQAITQGICQGAVLALGRLDLVGMGILVFLDFSLVFVLVEVLVSNR